VRTTDVGGGRGHLLAHVTALRRGRPFVTYREPRDERLKRFLANRSARVTG
jgi:hypothetical protein